VEGLKGSPKLKVWLETHLVEQHGLGRASGSTVTGNILIVFDEREDPVTVAHLVQEVVDAFPDEIPGLSRQQPNPSCPEDKIHSSEKTSLPVAEALVALTEKVKHMVSPLRPQPSQNWHTLTGEEVLALVRQT